MTDDWDFYALRVDGEPASIFVDLGIRASVPIASLPCMAYVRLYMQQPTATGLSSREEFDTLVRIEDALAQALCSDAVGYVGRNTSGGCRDFYFYTASADGWRSMVEQALAAFPAYRFDVGARDDAEWGTYLNFLLPGDEDRQRIRSRRVCQVLESRGDELTQAREIDHWCHFQTRGAADAFLTACAVIGFQVRNRSLNEAAAQPFGVQVWRMDVPSYENIDEVTLPLFSAARECGGSYDGWECALLS